MDKWTTIIINPQKSKQKSVVAIRDFKERIEHFIEINSTLINFLGQTFEFNRRSNSSV